MLTNTQPQHLGFLTSSMGWCRLKNKAKLLGNSCLGNRFLGNTLNWFLLRDQVSSIRRHTETQKHLSPQWIMRRPQITCTCSKLQFLIKSIKLCSCWADQCSKVTHQLLTSTSSDFPASYWWHFPEIDLLQWSLINNHHYHPWLQHEQNKWWVVSSTYSWNCLKTFKLPTSIVFVLSLSLSAWVLVVTIATGDAVALTG